MKKILLLTVCTLLLTISVFAANLKKIEVNVSMHCKSCQNNIEKTLKSTEGIKKTKTNFKEQIVKIEFDSDIIKEEKIVKIINDLGYKASLKTTENKK